MERAIKLSLVFVFAMLFFTQVPAYDKYSGCELHANITTKEYSFLVKVLVACAGVPREDISIKVSGPENFVVSGVTDSQGIFSFTAETPGYYIISTPFTDDKILLRRPAKLTVTRNFNNYQICSPEVSSVLIKDSEKEFMLALYDKNCAIYSTQSPEFEIHYGSWPYIKSVFKAGKHINIELPDIIVTGTPFIVKAYDNSAPLANVKIKVDEHEVLTDSEGRASLTLPTEGTFELIAEKMGFVSTSITIKVEKPRKFSVIMPSKVAQNKLFEITVKDSVSGVPVSGVEVLVGEKKFITDKSGRVFTSASSLGKVPVIFTKQGYETYRSEIFVEKSSKENNLLVSYPNSLYPGSSFSIIVQTADGPVEGASVVIGDKEYVTDAGGVAKIDPMRPGVYLAHIKKSGFEEVFVKITVVPLDKFPENYQKVESPHIGYFIALCCSLAIMFIGLYMMWHRRRYGYV